MFDKSLDNKRYHTLNYYYKTKFKKKVSKISLNGNFSCPNFKNNQGCIFCSLSGSGDFAGDKNKNLKEQFDNIKTKMDKKWPNALYIAYFQANTNTYAPLNILKEKYEQVIKFPNVIGLNIATRSDAISQDVLDYLTDLNKRTFLTVELGLQSMHDRTLKFINRGHDLNNFEQMVKKLKKRNINVVVHIINGLPYETKNDMIQTVKYLNSLKIDGIKIHMLYILKNTKLEQIYNTQKFHVLNKDEYIDIVCEQLRYLNKNIVIHRITGDPKKEDLVAPSWLLKKFCVLNDIDKEMVKRNIYQGDKVDLN